MPVDFVVFRLLCLYVARFIHVRIIALNMYWFDKDLVFVWAWWTWKSCANDWYIVAVDALVLSVC
jgi:hypothetical protein